MGPGYNQFDNSPFNSIKVRVKQTNGIQAHINKYFQFHKGASKTF